ncbi:nuclear transport factor 2 family protein [Streptomyces sp. NPDC058045]|uniref:nuclear transport factor 2 family protein n=1 Tax=Streptomyces sp. NPDC058045 TaxID=3346311 RepID=UPI0036E3E3B3
MTKESDADLDPIDAWGGLRMALEHGDPAVLRELLDEDFVLGHMTGRTQSREEWVNDIAAGRAVYHSIEDVDIAVEPGSTAADAVVTARTMTDVTIDGERGRWRTAFRTAFRRSDGGWVATRTDGSGW